MLCSFDQTLFFHSFCLDSLRQMIFIGIRCGSGSLVMLFMSAAIFFLSQWKMKTQHNHISPCQFTSCIVFWWEITKLCSSSIGSLNWCGGKKIAPRCRHSFCYSGHTFDPLTFSIRKSNFLHEFHAVYCKSNSSHQLSHWRRWKGKLIRLFRPVSIQMCYTSNRSLNGIKFIVHSSGEWTLKKVKITQFRPQINAVRNEFSQITDRCF